MDRAQWEAEGYVIIEDAIASEDLAALHIALEARRRMLVHARSGTPLRAALHAAYLGFERRWARMLYDRPGRDGSRSDEVNRWSRIVRELRLREYALRQRLRTSTGAYKEHFMTMLFLEEAMIRRVAASERLVAARRSLLGDEGAMFFSSYLTHGGQFRLHADQFRLGAHIPYIGSWMALEPPAEAAGRLCLVPGSHRWTAGEREHYVQALNAAYAAGDDSWRGLTLRFDGRPGAVIMWHGDLVHGSDRALRPELPRPSLACHFAPARCFAARELEQRPGEGVWTRRCQVRP